MSLDKDYFIKVQKKSGLNHYMTVGHFHKDPLSFYFADDNPLAVVWFPNIVKVVNCCIKPVSY